MNSIQKINNNFIFFYKSNFIMPIVNTLNINLKNEKINKKERDIFIKQYDKNAKIIQPINNSTGINFDIKR